MVKHELKARVDSLKARVKIQKCEFKSMSYELKSTSYEFKFTSYQYKSTSSRIINSMKVQVNSLQSFTRNERNKKWRFQFRVKKEFQTSICVRISFRKIECLFFCGDYKI